MGALTTTAMDGTTPSMLYPTLLPNGLTKIMTDTGTMRVDFNRMLALERLGPQQSIVTAV
jgi:hypothetical protein